MDNSLLIVGGGAIVLLLVLLSLGVHIAIALGLTGFLGLIVLVGFEPALTMATATSYYTVAIYSLVPGPLFILMGLLAAGGGVSENLYKATSLWLGKFKAALGAATVVACTGFGAVCGSSLTTAAVFAKISAPEMRKHGYEKKLAYGICAASGMIGMLIPPSLIMVIYAIVSGESVGALLVGGTVPGVLLGITFIAGLVAISKIKPDWMRTTPPIISITWRRRFAALLPVWPVFVVAGIVFGGIFGGVFNPTEASAAGAFILIVLLFIIRRGQAPRILASALTDAATIAAMVFLIMAGAAVFARFLVLSGVTTWLTDTVLGLHLSNLGLVIAFVVVYLILGMFLNGIAMLCMTVPFFHPIIVSLGIDPIWYSLVAIMAMEVGVLTPPVGLNVYATQAVAEPDVTIEDVFAGSTPFFFLSLITLAILIAFPIVPTWLPRQMVPM